MATLITNIKQLVNVRDASRLLRGKELSILPSIENAYVVLDNGLIAEYGSMNEVPNSKFQIPNTIDAAGHFVLPCWCDSHTHIVFATSREEEFVDKINGISYEEIAAKGGGILNSARKLNAMSEDELFDVSWNRLNEVMKLGTGAIEIKSGYGLSIEGELKMLRVIKKLKERSRVLIKSTFLGAHA